MNMTASHERGCPLNIIATNDLEWIGIDEAEGLSAMAHDLLLEVYDFLDREAVIRFYNETLTP